MYKLFAFLTVSFVAASAHAEIFHCDFSEPMISITLDTQTGSVKWTDTYRREFAAAVETVTVSERAVGAAFWHNNEYYRLALDLTDSGHVKNSNYTYPVYGQLLDYWIADWSFYSSLEGGCYSIERPRTCRYSHCY